MSNIKYTKKSPCNTCPYRKDVPLKYWHKAEFENLLNNERSQLGCVYGCHKKDGNVCVGWLMNQDENRLPSIMLRISLSKNNVTREYLDSLKCKHERFETVEEMIEANFPEILEEKEN